jgi:Na+-transporting NADH:ubiquinone oxidoreductase subunit NqrE
MTPSWRKPVGMLIILALITIWCAAVASCSYWVEQWPILVQLVFYVGTGIAWLWLLPMRRLLLWMETGRWR